MRTRSVSVSSPRSRSASPTAPAGGSDVCGRAERAEDAARDLKGPEARLGRIEQEIAEVQYRLDVAEQEMAEIRAEVEPDPVDR